jgi:hypothetical protein
MLHLKNRARALGCAMAAAMACSVPVSAESDAPLSVGGFSLTRQRKDISGALNLVTASLAVTAHADTADLQASAEYVDVHGAVLGKAGPTRVGAIAAGKTVQVAIAGTFIPIFNGYRIKLSGSVNGRAGEWTYFGACGVDAPSFLPDTPIPRQICLAVVASELEQDPKSPGARLYVRVRNLGAVKAEDTACFLEVRGKGGARIGNRVRAKLAGAKDGRPGVVEGGEERLFVVKFARFSGVESFKADLDWRPPAVEKALAGGEFTGAAEVELARFGFVRTSPTTLEISGLARNGLQKAVERVRVIIRLVQKPKNGTGPRTVVKAVETVIPDRIAPGDTSVFGLIVENVGAYDDFEYEVGYEEGGAAVKRAAASGQILVRVTDAARKGNGGLEIKGVIENTSPLPVENVEVDFHLRKGAGPAAEVVGTVTYALPGTLPPSEPAPFAVTSENCPPFDEYFYEIRFVPSKKAEEK